MKREFLDGLGLEKDVIDKIMAENGNDIEVAKSSKDDEIKSLQSQVEDANKTIKSYKDMDIDSIKKSADDWEQKAKDYEKNLNSLKRNTLLEKAVSGFNTVDADVVIKLLDRESLKFTDEKIEGLEEQINSLKESKSYLFKAAEEDNQGQDNRFNPHTPPDNEGGDISPMATTIASIFNE